MIISLRRRIIWVVAGGVIGVVLNGVLGLSVTGLIFMGLLGTFAVALGVALNSYQRHSRDMEAQP